MLESKPNHGAVLVIAICLTHMFLRCANIPRFVIVQEPL